MLLICQTYFVLNLNISFYLLLFCLQCSNLEESDPVETAVEGVERFKKEDCDVIIVDTSGRHKLKEDLLEEIRKVYEETVYAQ